jgi:hypothetical protein
MSVHRHEPCFSRRAIASRVTASVGAVALAIVLVSGLGCMRDEGGERAPHLPVPVDLQTTLAGAEAVPTAGSGPEAGAPARPRPPPPGDGEQCAHPGCIAPGPIPAAAQCHELRNHAPNERNTPYVVREGEGTTCFYYDVPWTEHSVLVAWQTAIDSQAMHEWQLYTATGTQRPGSAELCGSGGGNPNPISTNLSSNARQSTSQLVMAHPRGSNDILMPPGVGLLAPPAGTRLVLQWHHLNTLSAPVRDASLVRLCTLPAGAVERVASLTVLGTESLAGLEGLPAGRYDVEGSCAIRDRPVHVLTLAPHMHQLGRRVSVGVQRATGAKQPILDLGFAYDAQLMHATDVTLRPGDRLTSRCSYENLSGMPVPFGLSFQFEQCFVFAIAEPAGALDNGAASTLGVSNTCW